MTKRIPDELLRRYWTDDSLSDEERRRVEEAAEADEDTARRFEQFADEAFLTELQREPTPIDAEDAPAPDPNLPSFLRDELRRHQRAEHWSLNPSQKDGLRQLIESGQPLTAELHPSSAPTQDWTEDPPGVPVTIERLADDPLTLHMTSPAWPSAYEAMSLKLVKARGPMRDEVCLEGQVESLPAAIDHRPTLASPAKPQDRDGRREYALETLSALSREPAASDTPPETHVEGFRVQGDLRSGCLSVRATMPLDRGEDVIVAELAYERIDGRPAVLRQLLTLRPDRANRRWSLWETLELPELSDHASARVTLRCRSLGTADFHRLSPDQVGEWLSLYPPIPILAERDDRGFLFRVRHPSQLASIRGGEFGWVVQVTRVQEGN